MWFWYLYWLLEEKPPIDENWGCFYTLILIFIVIVVGSLFIFGVID